MTKILTMTILIFSLCLSTSSFAIFYPAMVPITIADGKTIVVTGLGNILEVKKEINDKKEIDLEVKTLKDLFNSFYLNLTKIFH